MIKSLLISLGILTAPLHDFHTSVMQIDHNEKNKSLEITVRLFTDDLVQVGKQWRS